MEIIPVAFLTGWLFRIFLRFSLVVVFVLSVRTFLVPPVVVECKTINAEPSVKKSPKSVKFIIYYIRHPFIIHSCRSSATVSENLS